MIILTSPLLIVAVPFVICAGQLRDLILDCVVNRYQGAAASRTSRGTGSLVKPANIQYMYSVVLYLACSAVSSDRRLVLAVAAGFYEYLVVSGGF